MIKFVVLGKPFGQKRPRAFRRGKFITVYSPQENTDYKKRVIESYNSVKGKTFYDENYPLGVKIVAYFKKGKITKKELASNSIKYNFPVKKPDGDNIAKAILDSLNEVAYHDDYQVVDLIVEKRYDDEERVEVEIWQKTVS